MVGVSGSGPLVSFQGSGGLELRNHLKAGLEDNPLLNSFMWFLVGFSASGAIGLRIKMHLSQLKQKREIRREIPFQ